MNNPHCPRTWEAEAARDGRLEAAALSSHERHVQHCTDCAQERQALQRLSSSLRVDAQDELVLRRLRQHVMASMNEWALNAEPGAPSSTRWRAGLATVALLACLSALTWFAHARLNPSPQTLRLVPGSGARYSHERRSQLEYVELHEGVLSIAFDRKRSEGLVVRVPDGEIRDLGTVFRVVVAAGKTQEISVETGAVVFSRVGEADVEVAAGHVYRRPAVPVQPLPTPATTPAASSLEIKRRQPGLRSKARAPQRADVHAAAHHAASASEQQDLAYLRILALLQEGRSAEARVAAHEYLSRFPNGFRRGEVERIAAPAAH
jgi:ferric-dicitrate binding protein FerR (iron transport regulator)